MCAFDVVANNADRKSGHVLLAEDRLWAIDNGLCFNEDDKLRTVIWDFGGQPLAPEDAAALERLRHDGPSPRLCELLTAGRAGRAGGPGGLAPPSPRPSPSWSTTAVGRPTPGLSSDPVLVGPGRLAAGSSEPCDELRPQGRSMCRGPRR